MFHGSAVNIASLVVSITHCRIVGGFLITMDILVIIMVMMMMVYRTELCFSRRHRLVSKEDNEINIIANEC